MATSNALGIGFESVPAGCATLPNTPRLVSPQVFSQHHHKSHVSWTDRVQLTQAAQACAQLRGVDAVAGAEIQRRIQPLQRRVRRIRHHRRGACSTTAASQLSASAGFNGMSA